MRGAGDPAYLSELQCLQDALEVLPEDAAGSDDGYGKSRPGGGLLFDDLRDA